MEFFLFISDIEETLFFDEWDEFISSLVLTKSSFMSDSLKIMVTVELY